MEGERDEKKEREDNFTVARHAWLPRNQLCWSPNRFLGLPWNTETVI